MTCSWSEERFERYLDDELTPLDTTQMRAHIERCAGCRSLLEELRAVDALLLQPRVVEPAANFTCKTMTDVRALPPPRTAASRVPAYMVCYLVAVWSLIGAGFALEHRTLVGFGETALDIARTIVVAFGGMLHVVTHLGVRGELSSWTTLAGGIVIVDVTLVAMVVFARRLGAPQRQR